MPYKDPQKKVEWGKRWRKQSIENGYGKWLYRRRALRFADAEHFGEALKSIGLGRTGEEAQAIALDALLASEERWSELGPAPGGMPAKAPEIADDTLLAKLKLVTSRD